VIRPTSILLWDNSASAYVDLTNNVYTNTNFNFIPEAEDIIYIGSDRRFIGIFIDLAAGGGYTGLKYEYVRRQGELVYLPMIDSYNFDVSKYCRWNLPENWACLQFTNGFPYPVDPPDTVERFWIKLSATAVTGTAIISKIRLMPYASYTTPAKVAEFLQLKKNYFDETSTPTDLQVEDFIRRQEDYINYRTRKSWKLQPIVEETELTSVDYNRYGAYFRNRNLYRVYNLWMWNGSGWMQLNPGRSNDYFVNYDLGIIYMTRLFSLPAVYGMVGRYMMWGMGEYKNSLKVDYISGRNPETDPEFYMVQDIATKLVARDLLQHHDYSILLVAGSDKVPMEAKIRGLTEDTENRIDSLIGVVLY
jgi:hypothetical protein